MGRNIFVDGVILSPNQGTKNYAVGEPKQFFGVNPTSSTDSLRGKGL